jgi:N-succinyldiaminopimelate aminotransferase
LSDRYGFVIASDECYSEIYFEEGKAPLGGLEAAARLGRDRCERLVMFSSLSKRSNVPGLRSGFVAGDAAVLKQFLLYRTYHGTALSPAVQTASVAAWRDEAHVVENRRLYAAKFAQATPVIQRALKCERPDAAFYLWAATPIDDAEYARRLFAEKHVTVLPGSYLSRDADGANPGAGYVRIALVASPAEVAEAAARIASFTV